MRSFSDDAEFRTYLDQNGRMLKPEELRLRVYHGGVTPALRKVVWRMLLNIFPAHLTGEERLSYMKRKTGAQFVGFVLVCRGASAVKF